MVKGSTKRTDVLAFFWALPQKSELHHAAASVPWHPGSGPRGPGCGAAGSVLWLGAGQACGVVQLLVRSALLHVKNKQMCISWGEVMREREAAAVS